MKIVLCWIVVISSALAANVDLNPLSDEFIDYINTVQSTWKAGRNFDPNTPSSEIRNLLGSFQTNPALKYKPTVHSEDIIIPDTFDARTNWPSCTDVIGSIADQSACGSCWAVSATSAMSDRRCIASNGAVKVPVSAEDLLSCCKTCGNGCKGGSLDLAWDYWAQHGIVTGGRYNSSIGCKPYSLEPCDSSPTIHHYNVTCDSLVYQTPECTLTCTTADLEYKSELTYGADIAFWFLGTTNIQREILLNGPVSAGFKVYADFSSYKSGVYQHIAGDELGGHAVRIIGWGTENDVPYWLVANSWNDDWGDKGLFKIRRGQNECGIESEIYASTPKL